MYFREHRRIPLDKVAAENGGGFDVTILARALAKTGLDLESKLRVKLALLGSGFERN